VKKLSITRKPLTLNRETIRKLTRDETLLIRGAAPVTEQTDVPKTTSSINCTAVVGGAPCAEC